MLLIFVIHSKTHSNTLSLIELKTRNSRRAITPSSKLKTKRDPFFLVQVSEFMVHPCYLKTNDTRAHFCATHLQCTCYLKTKMWWYIHMNLELRNLGNKEKVNCLLRLELETQSWAAIHTVGSVWLIYLGNDSFRIPSSKFNKRLCVCVFEWVLVCITSMRNINALSHFSF